MGMSKGVQATVLCSRGTHHGRDSVLYDTVSIGTFGTGYCALQPRHTPWPACLVPGNT